MKRYLAIFTAVSFLLLTLSSCTEKEADTTQPTDTTQPVPQLDHAESHLVAVIDSTSMTLDEFAEQITTSPTMAFADAFYKDATRYLTPGLQALIRARKPVMDAIFAKQNGSSRQQRTAWHIESYTYSFSTVSPSGEPIVLSARLTFPNNTLDATPHYLDSYSLFSHVYLMTPAMAPSLGLTISSARALHNSAVIEPDEQGYGIDYEQHSVTYCASNARARQLMDCAMAAIELLNRHDVFLASNGYTTNWGNSLGSPAALAFARHYDLYASARERQLLRLRSTYLGEGPLDYVATLRYLDSHPDYKSPITWAFYGLKSLSEEQLLGHRAEDFLPLWMDTIMMPYKGGLYTFLHAASRNYDDFHDYERHYLPDTLLVNTLHADLLLPDGHINYAAPLTDTLFRILATLCDVGGWEPSTHIYMAHAKADNYIPYDAVHSVYQQISSYSSTAAERMHFLNVPTSTDPIIRLLGPHYGPAIEAMLFTVLASEPKNMRTFYHEE